MTDEQLSKDDEYYPFRWKVADFVEDLFVLHRTAVVGVIALLGIGLVLLGFLVLDWGSRDSETATDDVARTSPDIDDNDAATPDNDDSSTASTTTTTAAPTSSTTATSTTTTVAPTTSTTTTTTEAPVSPRAATSDEQLAGITPGAILELSPGTITLVGGLSSDQEADEIVALSSAVFPEFTIQDDQVVDESFPVAQTVTMRLSAPDLFSYNRDDLNPLYFPLIDQIASAAAADAWTVEVSGHTDDTGPADGNQRLSERRAQSAAQRLISQGVDASNVTAVGRGEDEPIASNGSEAGRLKNRRVEFSVVR